MSNGTAKPIRLSHHAHGYCNRRGFAEAEAREIIGTSAWHRCRDGRWEATKEFAYNALWNGTVYAVKRVRPIFVEELTEIVVVTVYAYFY